MASFLKNLNVVTRAQAQFLDAKLAAAGVELNGCQTKYVLAVCNNPAITQDGLAKLLFVNKSNASRNLAELEKRGFVTRTEGENDRRAFIVRPTEKAQNVLPLIRAANAEWRKVLTAGFSEEERLLLDDLSKRLCENAAAYGGGHD